MVDKIRQRWRLFAEFRGLPGASATASIVPAARPTAFGAPPAWRPLGPSSIANGQTKLGTSTTTVSGRVAAVAIDPNESAHILVGAAAGGIWESKDRGLTWYPRTDDQATLTVGALAFDPVNPQVVYAGTGEGNFYWPLGRGLLRSETGGQTWAPLYSALTTNSSEDPFEGQGFFDLFVDPTDTKHLLAATTLGIHETTNGQDWAPCPGPVAPCWDLSSSASLAGSPAGQAAEVLAACRDGLYRWAGKGQPWHRVPLPVPRGEPAAWIRLAVAHAPSNRDIAYAIGTYGSGDNTPVFLFQRSQSRWRTISLPPELALNQASYDWFIAVDPGRPDRIYIGSVALHKGEFAAPMWRWALPAGLHADQHAIAFDQHNAGVLYVGNDGGLFRSDDHGVTWAPRNSGLAITEIEYMAQHPTRRDWILAGTQDNGTIRYTGVPTWEHVADGDGGHCAVDQVRPTTMFHTFQEWEIERSDNQAPWRDITPVLPIPLSKYQHEFYCPMAIFHDPASPGGEPVIAYAGESVFISRDGGTQWLEMGLPPSSIASALCVPTSELVYLGCESGYPFKLEWDPAHDLWIVTQLDRLPRPGQPIISDIWASSARPDRVWITTSTVPIAGVFRSDSGGRSVGGPAWHDCTSGDLQGLPINAIDGHPTDPDRVWVATDRGVFETRNGTQPNPTWSLLGSGLPNALVEDLGFHAVSGALRAATRSRGVWEIDII